LRPEVCEDLLSTWSCYEYLNELFDRLGESIDLWIGHSAVEGTVVWPRFSKFVRAHGIWKWLFAPNINVLAVANFNGHFRKRSNKRFELFGPEMQSHTR
jgi:hypothetical protein